MRPFLVSRRMTSTTTLRRGATSGAIEVSPALLIMIASPRPTPNRDLGPCPAHIGFIRTAQERARYLRQVVDRHVRKGGQPVDDGRETAGGLWTPAGPSLTRPATPAVEDRSPPVDRPGGGFLRKAWAAAPPRERGRLGTVAAWHSGRVA